MNSKIKILYVTSNLGIGGLEKVVVQLCKNLNRDVFSTAVCCLHFKGELAAELEKDNIPVFLLDSKKRPDYFAFLKLVKVIDEFKPQVVHTHNINASIDGVIASILKSIPVIIHTDHARRFPDKIRYMVAEWAVSHFMKRIIAVSEETKKSLIKYEKISGKKIDVINNGVNSVVLCKNTAKTINIKTALNLESFQFLIGCIGRLEPEKGLIYLIRAMPEILRRFPNVALVAVGQGNQKNLLLMEAKKNGVEKNVFLIGPRLDVSDVLQIFDVYVLPSEREGLPLSLLEAMATERPIVATTVGGIPNAITNEIDGLLVSPKSPEQLAEKICFLLSDEKLRGNLGVNARIRFENNYTIDKMVGEYQEIYLNYVKTK
jgi:glycosyltransferase involved in cell wall biosynthesis